MSMMASGNSSIAFHIDWYIRYNPLMMLKFMLRGVDMILVGDIWYIDGSKLTFVRALDVFMD
jgi:hypothetical protein